MEKKKLSGRGDEKCTLKQNICDNKSILGPFKGGRRRLVLKSDE
jgi:hypothetical protein